MGGGDTPAKTSRYSDPTAYEPDRIRDRLTVRVGNREYDAFDPTLIKRIEELAARPEPGAPTELELQERKLARSFTVSAGDKTVEVPMFRPILDELPDLKTAMLKDIEACAPRVREAAAEELRRIVLLLMASVE